MNADLGGWDELLVMKNFNESTKAHPIFYKHPVESSSKPSGRIYGHSMPEVSEVWRGFRSRFLSLRVPGPYNYWPEASILTRGAGGAPHI
jgi:hypothetical protein